MGFIQEHPYIASTIDYGIRCGIPIVAGISSKSPDRVVAGVKLCLASEARGLVVNQVAGEQISVGIGALTYYGSSLWQEGLDLERQTADSFTAAIISGVMLLSGLKGTFKDAYSLAKPQSVVFKGHTDHSFSSMDREIAGKQSSKLNPQNEIKLNEGIKKVNVGEDSKHLVSNKIIDSAVKEAKVNSEQPGKLVINPSSLNTKETIERNTGVNPYKIIITPNKPTVLNDIKYSGHALDRMQERGIYHSVIENAVKHIEPIIGKEKGTLVYYDVKNKLTIIQNEITGQIITVSKGIIKQ